VFGSPTYSYRPYDMRTKLEPTSKKGVFVGYGDAHKGYRIFVPSERRTIFCRNVIFYQFSYKMTSNTPGMEVQLDVYQKTAMKQMTKKVKVS
jgi:hypothetical protein